MCSIYAVIHNQFIFNYCYLYSLIIIICFTPYCKSDNGISGKNSLLLLENKLLKVECNYTDPSRPGSVTFVDWKWSKDGVYVDDFTEEEKQRISFDDFKHLSISRADKRDIGDWTCHLPFDYNQKHTTRVRAKPWLYLFDEYQKTNYKSANVIEGERFHLRCEVIDAYNREASVKWFRFNESEYDMITLKGNNSMEDMVEIKESVGSVILNQINSTLSTLTIAKVHPSDRYYYVCLSQNEVATVNNTILLRVKDKLGALWPFLGIVAEVVILCTIIFIYEKRRIKPDFDESDNDNNTEPKGSQTDRSTKTQDVRQRK